MTTWPTRLLPLLLLAAGCTSVTTSLRQPLPELLPGKGIVVFSTGASEASYMSVIALRLETPRADGGSSTSGTDVMMNRGYDSSDFSDEHGQVRMAVLGEGPHCLYPVHTNPYVTLRGAIPNFAFRVKAGAVTYVGSIFMDGLSLSVRNREKRDMELAVAAQPQLAPLPKATALAVRKAECKARF
jgi:hypothetical protein